MKTSLKVSTAPPGSLSTAALVIAAAFIVHSVNGLVVERLVLDLRSFTDYSDVDLLRGAIGSVPWRASGFGHLVSGFSMIVIGVGLHRWMSARGSSLAGYAQGFAWASAVGFMLNGVASGLGAQVVGLLEEQNPGVRGTAIVAYTVLVPVVNGLAIVCLGVTILLVATFLNGEDLCSRRFFVYSWLTGLAGLVMAFAYVPAYLFLDLGWLIWFAAIVRAQIPAILR